ncbi:hypothetical protein [Kiloniella majae]|uniref:hypothetical protein n=1 Tax=Kiloniella majae TaxID=1938558 RepID=UPI000A278959|nr:hypothetical protein [Kiloniella majae]
MRHWDGLQLDDFLVCHPRIRITEINDDKVELAGEYHLKAQLVGSQLIDKTFRLRFVCPREYPSKLPTVLDESNYFPRSQEYHTYTNGSFCLGSELKIKSLLHSDQSIAAFFENIVDPFLYAVSHRIEFGNYPFGELAHGEKGLIDDYEDIFGLQGKKAVVLALNALGKRKREANKLPCPCRCKKRLGRCEYRFILNGFRMIERRRWFREHLKQSFTLIERPAKKKRTLNSKTKGA